MIEHEDVGRERVLRVEGTRPEARLLVAHTRQAVPGFQHEDVKPISVPKKGDPGREVQTLGEDRNLEPRGKHNVAAGVRIEQCGVIRAERVSHSCCDGEGRQRKEQRTREGEAECLLASESRVPTHLPSPLCGRQAMLVCPVALRSGTGVAADRGPIYVSVRGDEKAVDQRFS